MKTIYLIAFCLMASVTIGQVKPDFRTLNWGMSMKQVKLAETKLKLIETNKETLIYTGLVLGDECYVLYEFTDGKLCSGFFHFAIDNASKNKYVEDYYNIQASLISKYGKPDSEEKTWRENLYKNDPDEIGMAIAAQHVYYLTEWLMGDTDLSLIMTAKDYKITIYLMYESATLRKEKIKNELQNEKKDI